LAVIVSTIKAKNVKVFIIFCLFFNFMLSW
jgi:hypothetical protein